MEVYLEDGGLGGGHGLGHVGAWPGTHHSRLLAGHHGPDYWQGTMAQTTGRAPWPRLLPAAAPLRLQPRYSSTSALQAGGAGAVSLCEGAAAGAGVHCARVQESTPLARQCAVYTT